MKRIFYLMIASASCFLTLQECYYDKFENFKPQTACDTAAVVTYANSISTIMNQYCYSCHSGASPIGGLRLDNYADVKTVGQSGKLYSSVTWDGGANNMPKGSSTKIDECSISSIKKWIDSNYPQ